MKTKSSTFYCLKRKKRQFVRINALVENSLNDEVQPGSTS